MRHYSVPSPEILACIRVCNRTVVHTAGVVGLTAPVTPDASYPLGWE
jgi:hypothetical protein